MGSNTSKQASEVAAPVQKNDMDGGDNSDPRSPTPEIIRTPLQTKTSAKHNITKNADLRKTLETTDGPEKLIHNNPILSAVIKNHLQSYDPRSPTQDFERTPIIIASKIDEDQTLQNKNSGSGSPCLKRDADENYDSFAEAQESPDFFVAKNLCNGFYDLSLNETIKETDEPLGSSTASNVAIETNISNQSAVKPMQLLETNFEYVDSESFTFGESIETNQSTKEVEEVSDGDLKYVPQFKILTDDPRSPSAGIDRTPIVISKTSDIIPVENVEEMSDDTLIKVLQSANADLRQSVAKPKNEGVLIYEDESSNMLDTPKKSKSGTSSDCRTPLSCMKNKGEVGHMRSKSANVLEDSKVQKDVAKPRRVSHIPRLKSLSKQTKLINTGSSVSLKNISKKSVVGGDCENTPPHSHRDKWDKDSSIVL